MCQHVEVGYEFSYWNEMLVFHVLGLECHIIIHPSARTSTLSHAHSHTHMPKYLHVLARKYTHRHTDTHSHTLTLPQKQTNTNTHFFVTIFNLWGMCDIVYRCQISQTAGNRIIFFFFIYWEVQGRFSHFSSFVIREGRRS